MLPARSTGTRRESRARGLVAGTLAATLIALSTVPSLATEAVGWRTDGTGHYPGASPLTSWSATDNVIWKAELGGWSNSTPTVVGDRIFVNVEPYRLVCLDRETGKTLWSAEHDYDGLGIQGATPETHDTNGWSTPTTVSDGTSIYSSFGNGVVARYSLDGKRAWARKVDTPSRKWGHSASPALVGDRLVVCIDRLIGLDAATGREVWRQESKPGWGSPVGAVLGDVPAVITTAGQIVRVSDGLVLAEGLGELEFNTPLVQDGRVYFMTGNARAYELPTSIPAAVAKGERKLDLEPLWESRLRNDRYYASPVLHDGKIYSITRAFILTVVDAGNGKKLWEARLDSNDAGAEEESADSGGGRPAGQRARGGRGGERRQGGRGGRGGGSGRDGSGGGDTVYSSFSLAGGLLYLASESGRGFILRPGDGLDVVAENRLPASLRACLVFDGARMYARAGSSLFCVGNRGL